MASRTLRTSCLLLIAVCLPTAFSQGGPGVDIKNLPPLPDDYVIPKFTCKFTGQFPYTVSIRDRTRSKEHICGGILIAKNAVLTAAHCVDPRTTQKATTTPDVHIGGFSSDEPIEFKKTVLPIPHPDWKGTTEEGNDLVILKLNNDSCLPPIAQLGAPNVQDRSNMLFLGYGRQSIGGTNSFVLNGGRMSTLNTTQCNDRYSISPKLGENKLCVRATSTVGICTGDDGGPLVYQPSFRVFRDVLIGIASYSTAACTATEGASVFIDIYQYREWIEETLKSDSFA